MPKVLIVDDEPAILFSTRCLLEALEYAVVTASNPQEALALARVERPDVVLHDVRMPGLDLDAHLRAMRADPVLAATPVVLFSASMELAELSEALGAAGFVEKPFTIKAVTTALTRALTENLGAEAGASVARS